MLHCKQFRSLIISIKRTQKTSNNTQSRPIMKHTGIPSLFFTIVSLFKRCQKCLQTFITVTDIYISLNRGPTNPARARYATYCDRIIY